MRTFLTLLFSGSALYLFMKSRKKKSDDTPKKDDIVNYVLHVDGELDPAVERQVTYMSEALADEKLLNVRQFVVGCPEFSSDEDDDEEYEDDDEESTEEGLF